MNCQSAGSYPGSHAGGRPATVLIVYPTGLQEPACDDCARYWVNTQPLQTRLAPLSSYVDNYEQAKAQMEKAQDAWQSQTDVDQKRQAWFASCPEDVLRRCVSGTPTGDDLRELDRAERPAGAILHSQAYYEDTALKARGLKTVRPYQHAAQRALRDRGLVPEPQQAIQGMVISTPSPATADRAGPPAGKQESSAPAIAMGIAAAIIAGLVMTTAGLPDGTQIGSQPNLAILLPGLALLIGLPVAGIIIFIRGIRRANRRWLSTLPPGQCERVRKAQNYAMGVAALGTVDLGLRAANKHTSANTARMQAAKQQRRAEAESQQRQQELLDAVRQGGQGQGPQGLQPKRWIPPGIQ